MAKPYDATAKALLENHAEDWVAFLGLPPGNVSLLDTDLAAITTDVDKVLRVRGQTDYLLHLEFQAGPDRLLALRLCRYNVSLRLLHRRPVETVLVLLRPVSGHRHLTGEMAHPGLNGEPVLSFRYRTLRVWETPPDAFLSGGVGLLPFAPMAKVTRPQVRGVVERMKARLSRERITEQERARLWVSTYILMGMRYEESFTDALLEGVRDMKESVTYQAILREGREEGRLEGAREIVLHIGARRYGAPGATVAETLARITDIALLEQLAERLFRAESWAELLADLPDTSPQP